MSDPQYELVIFGSTPLAGLMAGLLATAHRKRVVLVAETPSPYRLPLGFDLSVMPITRPESWALLKSGVAETLKLLRNLRAVNAVRHVDPIFIGETSANIAALSHMRQMAMAFGLAVERTSYAGFPAAAGFRYRDAVLLDPFALAPTLSAWLDRAGVVRLEARRTDAAFRRDGSVRLDHSGQTIEAARAVLADDEAISARLDPAAYEQSLSLSDGTITLLESGRRLGAPVVVHLDRGVTMMEQRDRRILAVSAGRPDEAAGRIGDCLADHGPLRRVGERRRIAIATADGAPLVGPLPGGKAIVLAGLGPIGVFLAPALARYLAGASSPDEEAYFSTRGAGRGARPTVSDYAPEASP